MPSIDDENERDSAQHYYDLQRARGVRRREILCGALPTTRELLLGLPFSQGTLDSDVALWVADVLLEDSTGPLASPLRRALRAFDERRDAVSAQAVFRIASQERPEWSVPHRQRHREICRRLTIYLAEYRDPDAQAKMSALAFAAWCDVGIRPSPDATSGFESVLRCLLRASAQSHEAFALRHTISHVRIDAAGPPPVQRTTPEPVVLDDDPEPTGTDPALDDDRAGIVRRVETPGLVVLASVAHLPGTASNGSTKTSFSSPRAEFASIAGACLPLVHEADVAAVAASIRSEWPWAASVTDVLLADLAGQGFFRFRNTLLVGPPGAGKTRLARRVGAELGMDVTIYPCAGAADASFGGTSRQWGTGRAGTVLQAIKRAMQANIVVVLDEIEKAGTRADNGRLVDALIPMLEGESAARYHDPYVECAVDLSAVSYIATANSLDGIPAPLLDRFRILQVPEPGPEHLGDLAQRIVDEIRRERGLVDAWLPDLEGDELDLLRQAWSGGSIRQLRRLVETLVSGRDTLARRH